MIRQAEALGYSRVLRRNRLLSDYDLPELQDYIDDRRNLGTFADVRFQYDLSVFESELPDIDEFDVGESYRADVVRRAIESQRNSDILDPNYLKILLDDLGRVATLTYRILSQRRVRPEAILRDGFRTVNLSSNGVLMNTRGTSFGKG